jgi:hypothetical protein
MGKGARFRARLKLFAANLSAVDAAVLSGLSVRSINQAVRRGLIAVDMGGSSGNVATASD